MEQEQSMQDFPNEFPNTTVRHIYKDIHLQCHSRFKLTDEEENLNFFKYAVLNGKILHNLETFINLIYLNSILELFLWLISLFFLVMSKVKKYYLVFGIGLHIPKSILGVATLLNMPSSNYIIENIQNTEYKIELIKESIIMNIFDVLKSQKVKTNYMLVVYFILNILSLLADIGIFIFQIMTYKEDDYNDFNVMLEWIIIWILVLM